MAVRIYEKYLNIKIVSFRIYCRRSLTTCLFQGMQIHMTREVEWFKVEKSIIGCDGFQEYFLFMFSVFPWEIK